MLQFVHTCLFSPERIKTDMKSKQLDERIKTDIKAIEDQLDKTLLLRGVEYNDVRIEPERKRIG